MTEGGPSMARLSANERVLLLAMAREHDGSFDEFSGDGVAFCQGFKALASVCPELDPHLIRRTVRSLARKGLTGYAKGLWSEDGAPMGAGYGTTRAGRELAAELEKVAA